MVTKTLSGLTKVYFSLIKNPTWLAKEGLVIWLRDTSWGRAHHLVVASGLQGYRSQRREDWTIERLPLRTWFGKGLDSFHQQPSGQNPVLRSQLWGSQGNESSCLPRKRKIQQFVEQIDSLVSATGMESKEKKDIDKISFFIRFLIALV